MKFIVEFDLDKASSIYHHYHSDESLPKPLLAANLLRVVAAFIDGKGLPEAEDLTIKGHKIGQMRQS